MIGAGLGRIGAALSLCTTVPAGAAEKRCGWHDNPTPGNHWLTDRARGWTIATQGEEGALTEDAPDFPKRTPRWWTVTNASSYGHGCMCMTVATDRAGGRITRIDSVEARPLRQCRTDKRLPRR